jgi:hypothetical protein
MPLEGGPGGRLGKDLRLPHALRLIVGCAPSSCHRPVPSGLALLRPFPPPPVGMRTTRLRAFNCPGCIGCEINPGNSLPGPPWRGQQRDNILINGSNLAYPGLAFPPVRMSYSGSGKSATRPWRIDLLGRGVDSLVCSSTARHDDGRRSSSASATARGHPIASRPRSARALPATIDQQPGVVQHRRVEKFQQ